MSQAAYTTGAYPGFRGMTQQAISPSILSGYPDSSLVPIYTPGWREGEGKVS